MLSDSVMFGLLDRGAARDLLNRLGPTSLTSQVGPGPSLGSALTLAATHPGVVTFSGHMIGPVREDERITVDLVQVHGDPVLDTLGPRAVAAAHKRLVELGLDATSRPERVARLGDGTWAFWWD